MCIRDRSWRDLDAPGLRAWLLANLAGDWAFGLALQTIESELPGDSPLALADEACRVAAQSADAESADEALFWRCMTLVGTPDAEAQLADAKRVSAMNFAVFGAGRLIGGIAFARLGRLDDMRDWTGETLLLAEGSGDRLLRSNGLAQQALAARGFGEDSLLEPVFLRMDRGMNPAQRARNVFRSHCLTGLLTYAPTPPEARQAILADPGFGRHLTDHMVSATWTRDAGWHDAKLEPYGPRTLHPAAAVLHSGPDNLPRTEAHPHTRIGRQDHEDRAHEHGGRHDHHQDAANRWVERDRSDHCQGAHQPSPSVSAAAVVSGRSADRFRSYVTIAHTCSGLSMPAAPNLR